LVGKIIFDILHEKEKMKQLVVLFSQTSFFAGETLFQLVQGL